MTNKSNHLLIIIKAGLRYFKIIIGYFIKLKYKNGIVIDISYSIY